MSVKAHPEKNFRRAKVKPVRKRAAGRLASWRMAATALVVIVALYISYLGTTFVLTASALQVRKIAVHGNVRLSSGEVQALVSGLRGSNILTADLEGQRRRLLESPWVADVALRRILPSTVEVFVSERRPIGVCRLGTHLYLIDRSGTIIDEFGPQYAEFDLPIIDGVVRPPTSGEPLIDERKTELAARVIESLSTRKAVESRVSQIDVSNPDNAIVLLDGEPALLYLGAEKFAERLQRYLELAPALKESVSEMDYVDLRFDERIYVRPVGPAARRNAAPAPAAKD